MQNTSSLAKKKKKKNAFTKLHHGENVDFSSERLFLSGVSILDKLNVVVHRQLFFPFFSSEEPKQAFQNQTHNFFISNTNGTPKIQEQNTITEL